MREQQHYQGDDGWEKVTGYLDTISAENILLVTGQSSYASSGAEQMLSPCLKGKSVTRISNFEVNPKIEDLSRLFDEIGDKSTFDVIIAIGGGSVIDIAKLLKAFWLDPTSIHIHLEGGGQLPSCELPLIAMPTTAGSGSDATSFAVLYKDKEKYSVEADGLLPDFSLVIPSLLKSVPKHTAACSGMDALCQGIESYWSIHSTDESRQLAREAIELAWYWIEEAVSDGSEEALHNMARASHSAGRAINITKTTAPHAFSYPMTSYFGITHGHAVGLLTSVFFDYNTHVNNTDCQDTRGCNFVMRRLEEIAGMIHLNALSAVTESILEKMKLLGLETQLSDMGLSGIKDIDLIVKMGFCKNRVINNPRTVSVDIISYLLTNQG